MPKANARLQAYLIIDKDTFGLYKKFMTDDKKITSNGNKMGTTNCWSLAGGTPTWRIENDSIFLIKLLVGIHIGQPEENTYIFADLAKEFKERYVNGRVFAKEINNELIALNTTSFDTDKDRFYNETISFLTIKHGKLVKRIEFTGTSQWSVGLMDGYNSDRLVTQKTDWNTQPEVPLNGGTKVVAKIAVDDKGKVTKTEFTEGGDNRWNKSIFKIIKFLSRLESGHISFIDYDVKAIRRKKEIIKFIVKKPR